MRIKYIILFLFLGLDMFSQTSKGIKNLFKYLDDYEYIYGDTITQSHTQQFIPSRYDTILLSGQYMTLHKGADDFMICNHETTFGEYKRFMAANDSINEISPKETYDGKLGDLIGWFIKGWFEKDGYKDYPVMGVSYYQVKKYIAWKNLLLDSVLRTSNIPESYCHFKLPNEIEWMIAAYALTDDYKAEMKNEGESPNMYRANPFAVQRVERDIKEHSTFSIFDENLNPMTNLGAIFDINSIYIKSECTNMDCFSSKIKSYPPNSFDLYDMSGNVAEWTDESVDCNKMLEDFLILEYKATKKFYRIQNKPNIDTAHENEVFRRGTVVDVDSAGNWFLSCNKQPLFFKDTIKEITSNTPIKRIVPKQYYTQTQVTLESKVEYSRELIYEIINALSVNDNTDLTPELLISGMHFLSEYYTINKFRYNLLRDLLIVQGENPVIVKGGSFISPLVGIMIESKQVVSKNTQSPTIGFRLALELSKEMIDYLERNELKPDRK